MVNLNFGSVGDVKALPFADRGEILKPGASVRTMKRSFIKPCCLRAGAITQSMPRPDVFMNTCRECGARHIRFHAEPKRAG